MKKKKTRERTACVICYDGFSGIRSDYIWKDTVVRAGASKRGSERPGVSSGEACICGSNKRTLNLSALNNGGLFSIHTRLS